MTVRRRRSEYRGLIIAAALIVPLVATGCATPLTHFEWGTERTAAPKQRQTRYASNRYEYNDRYSRYDSSRNRDDASRKYAKTHCACDDVPVPSARPSWYQRNIKPYREEATESDSYSSTRFQWPVRGRVLSDFGTYAGGGRNDGINISAAYGEPIRAAADGTVSYSGNELKSYGNLVLVRHADGYVTAYAHADRFVVEKGDHVARGQVIGYVGSTGDVAGPQLHFELRKGSRGEKPVNPRPLLGPLQVASGHSSLF
jgi:murein DD-endopeptidase MepM/ murein hydrolase activator NlpD